VVCAGCRAERAVEDDVVSGVTSENVVWVGGLGRVAQTFHGVVGTWPESVGVVGVKAVCNSEAEYCG
jgi:hypothetical protein